MRSHLVMAAGVVACATCACQNGLDAPAGAVDLDEPFFRCEVQPVLTKSCSTFKCHGDARRYFKIFARNRLRFGGGEEERNATMREVERGFNFESARAFVDADFPEESLLLLEPLDEAAGGYYHGGAVIYGRGDVFQSRDEADFVTLRDWIMGARAEPQCVEPGSDR
jgi:hypothetical protein